MISASCNCEISIFCDAAGTLEPPRAPPAGAVYNRLFAATGHPDGLPCQPQSQHRVESTDRAYAIAEMTPTIAPTAQTGWTPARVQAAATETALEAFLTRVQRRALRMAELATGHREEALDLVQDAMFGFVRRYAAKAETDWTPLFFRVLDSRLHDWYRRRRVRDRWAAVLGREPDSDHADDAITRAPDLHEPGPMSRTAGNEAMRALDAALGRLPLRQRQAFLLRIWQGFDVATTATCMRCSEGSVKTHLSRAVNALRAALEDHHEYA